MTLVGLTCYLLIVAALTIRGSLPSNTADSSLPTTSRPVIKNSSRRVAVSTEMVEMLRINRAPAERLADQKEKTEGQKRKDETECEITKWKFTALLKVHIYLPFLFDSPCFRS